MGDLEPMADRFEEADEIDVIERSVQIVRHKRQKYRCRCGATSRPPRPRQVHKFVPGGRCSIDSAVAVAIAKFADRLEAEAKRVSPEGRLAALAELRAKQSKPFLDEIRIWLMTRRTLPRSALGKAIAYTSGLWPGLLRFPADPKIRLDTNGVERALRGVAIGRKNHYGSRSERGNPVAALFYSLIESAMLVGVEPRTYVGEAARRAIRNAGTVTLARDLE